MPENLREAFQHYKDAANFAAGAEGAHVKGRRGRQSLYTSEEEWSDHFSAR